jgi:hypothetical protein
MRRAAALLVLALAAPALAEETTHADDWYAVYLNGQKAGHAHTVVLKITDPTAAASSATWVTTTDTQLKLSRMGAEVELVIGTRIEENAEGRVTGFRQTQSMSEVDIVTQGRLAGDVLRLDQNGVPGRVAYPEGALGPAAVDRRVAAAGFEPGTTTTVRGFTTEAPGTAAELTFAVEGTEGVHVIDRKLRLHKVKTTNSQSAARSMFLWYDGNGRMQVSESDVPGVGVLRMVRTSELLARAVSSPAEVFASSLIEPDRGIEGPRRARRAVFRFARIDGEAFEAKLYEGEGQTVGPLQEDGSRTIAVERWEPPRDFEALQRPVEGAGLESYLAPSAYLESDDPLLREHAVRTVGDQTDALVCARRIEAYVRTLVADKSMDVGFATAAETVRSREGDCSEHAMLTAAMARAVGLPSRVVMGLVYVPGLSGAGVGPKGAFGYHMWTEVLVAEDRWFPIDAAIGGFDATHIAMAKSDLSTTSPVSQMILPLLEAISSLSIHVVDVERVRPDFGDEDD